MVDRRERHQRGQQLAKAFALEPAREQLHVTGLAGEDVDEVEAGAVPVLQVGQLLGEHHRRRGPVAVQQRQPRVRVAQHRRGDRHHRRDPGAGGDAQVASTVGLGAEAALRGLHLDLVTRTDLVDQPLREPTAGDQAYADPRPLPYLRADRVVAAMVLAVDDPAQGQGLPGLEVVRRTQVLGHVEGDGDRVVAEALDRADRQGVEVAPHARLGHQISFTCSNGSRQDVQRYIALHAVGPNSEVSSTSPDPQRGQVNARRVGSNESPTGPAGAAPGWRDAVPSQRLATLRRDPVARPGRAQADAHLGLEAGVGEPVHEVVAHGGHRRAAGVRRRDRHDHPAVLLGDRPEHTEVLQGEHRHLRVGDGCRDRGRRTHQTPSGWARATDCISASRCESASVCRPSRPMPPATGPIWGTS